MVSRLISQSRLFPQLGRPDHPLLLSQTLTRPLGTLTRIPLIFHFPDRIDQVLDRLRRGLVVHDDPLAH